MKKQLILMGILAVFGWVATGCGSSSDSTSSGDSGTGSTEITTIDELPKASDPVTSSTSSSASAKIVAGSPSFATTGMPYGTTDSDSFDSTSSIAACEMFNMTKEAINQAVMGDLILCYIQQIYTATEGLTIVDADSGETLAPGSIPIYDGAYHTFSLAFPGDAEEGGPDHVKFKINKSGDTISGLEMFSCVSGAQEMYLSQDISGDDFTMTGKGIFENDCSNGFTSTVTGTLNTSGDFVGTKTIGMSYTNECSDGGIFYGTSSVEQTADSMTLEGRDAGTFIGGDGNDGSYGVRVVGAVELLDGNAADTTSYDVNLLALGDGAVEGIWSGSFGTDEWEDTFTDGWNGDTTMTDSTAAADWLTIVGEMDLPAAAESVTVTFSGSDAYDCDDDVEAVITISDESIFNSCANLEMSHSWINCWDLIENGGEFSGEEEESGGSGGQSCTANSQCSSLGSNAVCSNNNCTISCTATSQCTAAFGSGFACTNSVCQPQ